MNLELGVALFLLGNLVVALFGAVRGPTAADRMLAALLFGSTGVGIMLLLGAAAAQTALLDVALVLSLLAAITGVAFVRLAWGRTSKGNEDGA